MLRRAAAETESLVADRFRRLPGYGDTPCELARRRLDVADMLGWPHSIACGAERPEVAMSGSCPRCCDHLSPHAPVLAASQQGPLRDLAASSVGSPLERDEHA